MDGEEYGLAGSPQAFSRIAIFMLYEDSDGDNFVAEKVLCCLDCLFVLL